MVARSVLVVEDSTALRLLLTEVIATLDDVQVTGCSGVTECVTLYQTPDTRYDAILIDIGLPDGDGCELCLTLRQSGCSVPIVILTGHRTDDVIRRCMDAGATDYLIKPIGMASLLARLRCHLWPKTASGL